MGWSKKYKRSIDCNNPKGFSQKAHCAGRKKRENVMSSKLEELVGKPITEEQFDEAAGKKDACYHKVKARYDVWPSAYASGALVKCRKVGAKNWGNSKKESMDEELNSSGYSQLSRSIKALSINIKDLAKAHKKQDDSMLRNEIDNLMFDVKRMVKIIDNKKYNESVNEGSMELKKLEDAIKMFQKKIKKQGRVTNARDEDHLENLIKIYKQMGGKGVKEGLGDRMAKKLKKHKGVNLKKKKIKLKGRGVYQDYDGLKEDVFFESTTENGMTTNHVYYEIDGKGYGYTLEFANDLNEAEYQGRKVKLGKIMQGDVKKFKVYVKNPKGNVVKVNFGQGGDAKGGTMRIRKSNPKARANFRARHNCDNPGPRHKARYWSCRKW